MIRRRGEAEVVNANLMTVPVDPTPAVGGYVCLGVVSGARGMKGEVRIKSFAEQAENIAAYGPVYDESGERSWRIKVTGQARGQVIARLDGVEDLAGEQDHAGACPQERLPGGGEFPQGRPQVEGVHELDQGRALIELFGLLYDQGGALEIIQYADVGGKVALQPQDTYSDGYQPLVCSSWPSSRVPISMPGMASPRSSETRTSTSGSS